MEEQKYIPTIGLEIHAELSTKSKMFCSCKNDPDEERPNVNVCPICLGHPGTLPVLNKEAIRSVLKIGLAVNGTLADFTEWDRKNYFYPDIPKGYQISQYKYPLVSGGELASVGVERIHLEEDTAQSTHDTHEKSLVNFNRSGVPLMELVTKPAIHDAETAMKFAQELQLLLRYLHAGEANMEKGEMRVEANISVSSPADMKAGKFGTKTEVKNLNSFRSVGRAIEFEVERQIAAIEAGEKVIQETRGWDDNAGETYSQRVKEGSADYRYFPDPDIPKMKISEIPEFSTEALKKDMVELPWVRREKLIKEPGMTIKEAEMLVVADFPLYEYYKEVTDQCYDDERKILAKNLILNDYLAEIYLEPLELDEKINVYRISSTSLSELVNLRVEGILSASAVKKLMKIGLETVPDRKKSFTGSFKELADKHGLIQKSDAGSIAPIIDQVLKDNAKAIAEYKAGKLASLQFLIGMSMKAAKGAANPEIVKKLLLEKLG